MTVMAVRIVGPGEGSTPVNITSGGLSAASSPEDSGLKSWAYDPLIASNSNAITLGALHLMRFTLRSAQTITTVHYAITTGGTTLTAGQTALGIYSAAGLRLAQSADLSTPWQTPNGFATALTAPVDLPAGNYWVGILANGGVAPSFRMAANNFPNTFAAYISNSAGQTAATARVARNGAALTALPASFTPAANVTDTFIYPIWYGLT